jgi:hypothetical protein
MTQAGILMGTPNYMSPEQVQTAEITGRADQFSLAVVLYELLSGKKPFAADNLPALLFKIVREDAEPPHHFNPSIGEGMELVLGKAMAKDPAARFDNCVAFVEAFENASKSSDWMPARVHVDASAGIETVAGTIASLAPQIPPAPLKFSGSTLSDSSLPGSNLSGSNLPASTLSASTVHPPAASAGGVSAGGTFSGTASSTNVTTNGTTNVPPGTPFPDASLSGGPSATLSSPSRPRVRDSEDEFAKRGRWPLILLVLAAVAALGGAGYFLTSRPEQPMGPYRPPLPLSPPLTAHVSPPVTGAPVVSAAAAVADPPAPAPASTATFRLTTNPAGAESGFDGDASSHCTTPCSMNLPLGRHSALITHSGYRDAQRIFNLPEEPGLIVNLEAAMGTLNLVTTPAGLAVAIDGQQQSQKTPASFSLPPGAHRVEVLRGAEKQEFNVDIRDGILTQRNITWN